MTLPVKRIVISGFRGILSPLSLNFVKGKRAKSMIIYGRNGTGKSSITDAWEWIHTGRIVHLAREGAGPSSYPHKNAEPNETFVEIEFSDPGLGTAKLQYDTSRITIPISEGELDTFRALIPHPSHIRFEDLTRFVYLTKSEKYDQLAQLMGFTPQVELQKALRRVLKQLQDKVEAQSVIVQRLAEELSQTLGVVDLSEATVLTKSNELLARYEVPQAYSMDNLSTASTSLTREVESDPHAQELANLQTLRNAIKVVKIPDGLIPGLRAYVQLADNFKDKAQDVVNLLLIGLYEKGQEILQHHQLSAEDAPEKCPLCGQVYQGRNLLAHISEELGKLQELRRLRDEVESKCKQVRRQLDQVGRLSQRLNSGCEAIKLVAESWSVRQLFECIECVERARLSIDAQLAVQAQDITPELVKILFDSVQVFSIAAEELDEVQQRTLGPIVARMGTLRQDDSRGQLVKDHTVLTSVMKFWNDFVIAQEKAKQLGIIYDAFESIVDDYIRSSIANVQQRFEAISEDVQTYFQVLEQDAVGLGSPTLILLPDQDRAVVLQVEFYGAPVYPAYRYLSESQLNSFGLAIFLASAKHFNQGFKFLILDDVINSFDGYKRPRLIELLKREFSEHQILILTHDRVWRDRLYEACPSWVQLRFDRWEIGHGPIYREGVAPLAMIKRLINEDEPVRAGRDMGAFLERQLQELCEAFEASVKYNQRNEYTLSPLLESLRSRVRTKLSPAHNLYIAIEALQSDQGFRNLCVHWKNPDIQFTPEEMQDVVDKWEIIERLVRCQREECYTFVRYDGQREFKCRCGETTLKKPSS